MYYIEAVGNNNYLYLARMELGRSVYIGFSSCILIVMSIVLAIYAVQTSSNIRGYFALAVFVSGVGLGMLSWVFKKRHDYYTEIATQIANGSRVVVV